MALPTISPTASCRVSWSWLIGSSWLSHPAKVCRAVRRLDRLAGSSRSSPSTGAASHSAASVTASPGWAAWLPSSPAVCWAARSALVAAPPRPVKRPARAAAAAASASRAMLSSRVWVGSVASARLLSSSRSPGSSRALAGGWAAPVPSGPACVGGRQRDRPSVPAITGAGWPQVAYCSVPLAGLSTASTSMLPRSPGAAAAKRSARATAAARSCSAVSTSVSTARSWPMPAIAGIPEPATMPTASAMSPPASGTASNQPPPGSPAPAAR